MKSASLFELSVAVALLTACSGAYAATIQLIASASVTASCAVVAPSSIPSAVQPAGSYANVSCTSPTPYAVVLTSGTGNAGAAAPATSSNQSKGILAVTY